MAIEDFVSLAFCVVTVSLLKPQRAYCADLISTSRWDNSSMINPQESVAARLQP